MRCHARKHAAAGHQALQLPRAGLLQLAALHHRITALQQAKLAGDSCRRDGVIARDHPHANARFMATLHRQRCTRPQRIHQPQQPQALEATGLRWGGLLPQGLEASALGQSQHPQPLARQRNGLLQPVPLRGRAGVAHRQHTLRSALHQHADPAGAGGMKAGGEAVFRLKRNCIALGLRQQRPLPAQALLAGELQQRHIGGITATHPIAIAAMQIRFIAEHRSPRQPLQRHAIGGQHPLHRELIAGERAGFVAGDQGATAQSLHGGEPPHDHLALRHAVAGHCQSHRERHGQPLGDG